MSKNGAIFRIVPFAAGQVAALTPFNADPAFPAAALANIQPKVITRSPSGAVPRVMVIDIDLLADTSVSGVSALHTNLSPDALWQVFGATAAQGPLGDPFPEPTARRLFGQTTWVGFGTTPTTRENRRAALVTGGPHTVRYLRVYFTEFALPFIEIGTLLVLQRLALGQDQFGNFELGSGRRVDDRSQKRALPGGETAIERGGRVPQWRASWSNATEAQYRELWSVFMEAGTSAPILVAEFQDGSAGQAEALHYGTLQTIDFSERLQLDKQRIDLRIEELL